MDFDEDIARLDLGEFEKNGLQVYRNYQRSFEAHSAQLYSKEVDAETFDAADLNHSASQFARRASTSYRTEIH